MTAPARARGRTADMATRRVRARAARAVAGGDPVASARAARLRYVSDAIPGIRRRRAGRGFSYTGVDGTLLRDPAVLRRIRRLAIPPAWTEVWIAPSADAHIQATGRDSRRRKQYRYHERWSEVRDEAKFERMVAFGEALSAVRGRVDEDMRLPGLPRQKVVATVVRLLDSTCIRVGNEEYARENESYGLTTMRQDHTDLCGSTVRFSFRGKAGVSTEVDVTDRRVARVVDRCLDLPGEELFQYVGDDRETYAVRSDDVNQYLRETTGAEFSAKDFRTWAGTVLAATALHAFGECATEREARRRVVEAVKSVARRLRNTPAVCRRAYIHPEIFTAHLDGTLVHALSEDAATELRDNLAQLSPEEAAVLALLRARLVQQERRPAS